MKKDYMSHDKLLEKLNNQSHATLIIVGRNGAGKTYLTRQIQNSLLDNTGFYTINENVQFTEANPFNSVDYKNAFIHKAVYSTGESLYNQILDTMNTKDNVILDEPTATLDLLNSSIVIESFIRHNGKIKIITTNDYLTLKLLSNYINSAYNVETGTFVQIKDYINDLIDETINALSNLPFEMIPIDNYNKLKETHEKK